MEKPTLKQQIDGFCTFLYNSEDGTVMGRGGKSWGQLGFFYLIYYICLSAFFCGTIAVFYQTIDDNKPKLQGDDSLLKGNPGMGFSPLPDIETTLIRVSEKEDSVKTYVNALKTILQPYKEAWEKKNTTTDDCKLSNNKKARTDDTACPVDYSELTKKCNEANDFGFTEKPPKPCVLLKLNRIYGWMPQPYADGAENRPKIMGDHVEGIVPIKCIGENAADNDHMGLVEYYPQAGFPLLYFPYKKQENYMSPLVFARFTNATKHLGLMVECRAFATNIEVDVQEKRGSVHFELLIDRM